jgi:SAM-dependent methyltransferase
VNVIRRAIRRARRAWYGDAYDRAKWSREERIVYLEQVVDYLSRQCTRQADLLRHVSAPIVPDLPSVRQTKASFDFQWADIPVGHGMLADPAFRAAATSFVCQFTGLPPEWFPGKRVVDAGCGNGRYSWALCQLGATVLSLDQSDHGLQSTADACRDFPSHRVMKVDLLKPLPAIPAADLVWSFGVLHHTGDTYGAFRNVQQLVAPGGRLYLMLYGEPRAGVIDDYMEINEYESWRRRTANLPLRDKLKAIRAGMAAGEFRVAGDQYVHGYFDAIAPAINDLHTFEEVESWLLDAGFGDVRRTLESRNLHITARRAGADA